jgi:hypothetical protein
LCYKSYILQDREKENTESNSVVISSSLGLGQASTWASRKCIGYLFITEGKILRDRNITFAIVSRSY